MFIILEIYWNMVHIPKCSVNNDKERLVETKLQNKAKNIIAMKNAK